MSKRTRIALDLSSTSVHDVVTAEGVQLRVRLDANGRPVSVSSQYWDDVQFDAFGNANEDAGTTGRLVKAAVKLALAEWRAAATTQIRTTKSATKRRKRAEEHWTRSFFVAARGEHPDYRGDRLRDAARLRFAKDTPVGEHDSDEYKKKRRQITTYRAQQFLDSIPKTEPR